MTFMFMRLVHRIGRTGRSTNKGWATTFINKSNEESVLLDLKHLLIEAKQNVPPFLATLQSETEVYLDLGGEHFDFVHRLKSELTPILTPQTTKAAAIAVVSAIVSPSVPNWKQRATSKSLPLDARIICPTLLRITRLFWTFFYFHIRIRVFNTIMGPDDIALG